VAYNYLLKNAIKSLSYSDFCDFFGFNIRHIKRSEKNKKIRASIIKNIPSEIRKYVTFNHELTRRDLVLKSMSPHPFFESEKTFNIAKKNIDRIVFFVYNLNVESGKDLNKLFAANFFDLIYLSNALDWIYWHNSEEKINIRKIIDNIKGVSNKGATLILEHLVSRKTAFSEYLNKVDIDKSIDYVIYKYNWKLNKILINKCDE